MKKILPLIILLVILGIILSQKDKLYELYRNITLEHKIDNLTPPTTNEYFRENKFNYVQTTDKFIPYNKQELLNVIYTIISSGQEEYTFYCPNEYVDCLKDLDNIAKNQAVLSNINNFVHPYNSFKHIETKYDDSREVTISYSKNYTDKDIAELNNKIDYLFKHLYNPKDTQVNNIKRIHNYIANNSRYDSNRADNDIVVYKSDIAYGPLIQGYALCGGYADAISLYLDKMNIINYKVSSSEHVWNAIKLNNKWYHLDLTWDDPITDTGENYILYDYFLIDTKTLKSKQIKQHNFNQIVYSELQ